MKNNTESHWLKTLSETATPSIDECVAVLGKRFDWLHLLKSTPQDPEWHGEGDVHIHTGMVLNELYNLLENDASHITGWRRQSLILGALFHDIGKPKHTKDMEIRGTMRTASPKHENAGRSYLAFKLMELELPFNVVWSILGLVGEHHMPKLLVVKNASKGTYIALARRANLELLYWLEIADMKGRICPDLNKQLTILDEFKMFAEEYKLWQAPFDLSRNLAPLMTADTLKAQSYLYGYSLSDLEESKVTFAEESLSRAFEYKNNHPHLYLTCGPSGSGKSQWIAKNCKIFLSNRNP